MSTQHALKYMYKSIFFVFLFLCFYILIPLILIHNKYLKVLMRMWNNLMAVRSTIRKSSTQIRACKKYSSSLRRIKKRKKVVFNNQLKFISSLNLFYGMEWSKWCPTYLVSGYFFDLFLQKLALTANKTIFTQIARNCKTFFQLYKTGPWSACNIQGCSQKIVGSPWGPIKMQ